MIKQVIDRSVFTLNYPHRSRFMGGIWIAGNYHFFIYITGTVAVGLTSKQESVRKSEPFQFSPPQCLWAAEIISSSWDPFQQTRAEDGLKPSPFPLHKHFRQTKAKSKILVANQVSLSTYEHQSISGRSEPPLVSLTPPGCLKGFSHAKS